MDWLKILWCVDEGDQGGHPDAKLFDWVYTLFNYEDVIDL